MAEHISRILSADFGLVLYQVAGLTRCNIAKLIKECIPFIIMMVAVLFIISYWEGLTLFIPNLIYGK
jgi:TRAP-type C4-dicarboxylate transport system permease large subunit